MLPLALLCIPSVLLCVTLCCVSSRQRTGTRSPSSILRNTEAADCCTTTPTASPLRSSPPTQARPFCPAPRYGTTFSRFADLLSTNPADPPQSTTTTTTTTEHKWQMWRFVQVPHGYWEQRTNLQQHFEWLAGQLGISRLGWCSPQSDVMIALALHSLDSLLRSACVSAPRVCAFVGARRMVCRDVQPSNCCWRFCGDSALWQFAA